MSGTLKEQLLQIEQTKDAIAQALLQQGIEVTPEDNFASYAEKISQIEGTGGGEIVEEVITTELGSAFNLFDSKYSDHILTGTEAKGWALQGTMVKAQDYPDFYQKCLEEYRQAEAHTVSCVNFVGTVTNESGILSNFSVGNFATIRPIDLTNSNQWEMVVKFKANSLNGIAQHILNGGKVDRYLALAITTSGKLCAAVADATGANWQFADDVKDTHAGKTILAAQVWYWAKLEFTGQKYILSLSTDGINYNVEYEYVSTVRPFYSDTINFNIGISRDNENYAFDGQVDLSECYIKVDEQKQWCGCVNVYKHTNDHMFYPIANKENIDAIFNYYDISWFYGIDEENNQIMLPRDNRFAKTTNELQQNVKKLHYICVGNTGVNVYTEFDYVTKSGNDLFDLKLTDGIYNKAGWAAQGSVVYRKNYPEFYKACKQEFLNGQKVYASTNVTKQGSLKDNNGVISNFSKDNTAIIPCFDTSVIISWETVVKFNLNTVDQDMHIMSASSDKNIFAICVNNKKITYAIGSKYGDAWQLSNLDVTDTQTLQAEQDYWAKVEFTGSAYILSLSTDGVMYEQQHVFESQDHMYYDENCFIILGANRRDASQNILDGSIDLNECFITLNGSLIWQGVKHKVIASSGREYNDTSYQIDLENETVTLPTLDTNKHIYYCVGKTQGLSVQSCQLFDKKMTDHKINDDYWALSGSTINKADYPEFYASCRKLFNECKAVSDKYTIVGKPTIEGANVSNFSTSNYIKTPKISLGKSFEIQVKFTTKSVSGNIFNICNGLSVNSSKTDCYISIGGTANNTGYIGYNIGNGSSWYLNATNNANQGNTQLKANTTYYVRMCYDGTTYKSYLSQDGQTWTLDWSYKSSSIVPDCTLVMGVDRILKTTTTITIHLDECYIKLADKYITTSDVYTHESGIRFYDLDSTAPTGYGLYGISATSVVLPKYDDYTYICVKERKPHYTSCFNMFDKKQLDRRLSKDELNGWALTGTKVYKHEYPDFYNACLKEYQESKPAKEFVKHNVTLVGDIKEDKGVLSGFSVSNYARTTYTIPSTIKSFDMTGAMYYPKDGSHVAVIYGQSTSNYENPQTEVSSSGLVWCGASFSKSSWNINLGGKDTDVRGKKVWIKFTWDGSIYRVLYSLDGKQYTLANEQASKTAPYWNVCSCIGWDDGGNIAYDCNIDLKECYIDINGQNVWSGCKYVDIMQHENGHKFYTKDTDIDYLYEMTGKADVYGIFDEYIVLPRVEDNTYYCVGNTEVGSSVIDISNEVQLNSPFFIGQSQYFEVEPNNLSWLKSNGEFHSKDLYPSMYNYILENVQANTKDFANINSQYDDYCYVLDQENETFRLPLLNGEEIFIYENNCLSNVIQHNMVTGNTYTFIAPCNGNFKVCVASGSTGKLFVTLRDCAITVNAGLLAGSTQNSSLFMRRGQTAVLEVTTGPITLSSSLFSMAKGKGDLYFYVGETVNNANLIDLGKIATELSDKVSSQSNKLEGSFITANCVIATGQSITTEPVIYDLSEYLPDDNHDYLVWVTGSISTNASTSAYINLHISSDILMNDAYLSLCGTTARSNYSYTAYGSCCLPVGKARQLMRMANTSGKGAYSITLKGFRRMGA